uniref:Uncharacterized protein n=1 Tax=Arundo donax TaxID=35708 RepID=A0A0A9F1Y2_ARUDO
MITSGLQPCLKRGQNGYQLM